MGSRLDLGSKQGFLLVRASKGTPGCFKIASILYEPHGFSVRTIPFFSDCCEVEDLLPFYQGSFVALKPEYKTATSLL